MTITLVPWPSLLEISILPLWASTTALHRLSPSPKPPVLREREESVRKKGSKTCPKADSAMSKKEKRVVKITLRFFITTSLRDVGLAAPMWGPRLFKPTIWQSCDKCFSRTYQFVTRWDVNGNTFISSKCNQGSIGSSESKEWNVYAGKIDS